MWRKVQGPQTLDLALSWARSTSATLVEVLGRLADLAPAQAAYEACVKKYPDKPHLPAPDLSRDPQQRPARLTHVK